MRHDVLADVMYTINNADRFGKKSCIVPASSITKEVLRTLQEEGYIGVFEFIDDDKSGKFSVEMLGKVNYSRTIKPKFSVKKGNFEKWETRFLPSRDIGILIVSTSGGIITHKKAKEIGIGGKLLAMVF